MEEEILPEKSTNNWRTKVCLDLQQQCGDMYHEKDGNLWNKKGSISELQLVESLQIS